MTTHMVGRITAAALLSVVGVAGCGGAARTASSSEASEPHPSSALATIQTGAAPSGVARLGTADEVFAAALGAIGGELDALSGLVDGRSARPELATLAPAIAQRARTFGEWNSAAARAQTFVIPGPTAATGVGALARLAELHGAAFDDAWLEHTGGVLVRAMQACDDEVAHGTVQGTIQQAGDWRAWFGDQFEQLRTWHHAWASDTRFPAAPVPTRAAESTPPPVTTGVTASHHPEPATTHHPEATTHHPEATTTHHSQATTTHHPEATTHHPVTTTHHPETTTHHPEATTAHHPESTTSHHPEPTTGDHHDDGH